MKEIKCIKKLKKKGIRLGQLKCSRMIKHSEKRAIRHVFKEYARVVAGIAETFNNLAVFKLY